GGMYRYGAHLPGAMVSCVDLSVARMESRTLPIPGPFPSDLGGAVSGDWLPCHFFSEEKSSRADSGHGRVVSDVWFALHGRMEGAAATSAGGVSFRQHCADRAYCR